MLILFQLVPAADQFFALLLAKTDTVTEVPLSRFDVDHRVSTKHAQED